MTKQSKSLLKQLIKFSGKEENLISFLGDTTCFCLNYDTDHTMDYSDYSKQIHGIIQYLVDEGYLVYAYENNTYHFQLTHNGLNYQQIHWLKIRDFLIHSIFTPIIVSLVTTLLTLLVQWLLTTP